MTETRKTAAFLGLGVMGYPMAGHLKRAGYDVCVFNRTAAKADAWVAEYGGRSAPTPREAAAGADVVMACVGADDDLRQVVSGPDAAFAGMEPGAVFIDHTTASASVARELAREAERRGLHFLDCPVSGGQLGAQRGTLAIMAGGDAAVFERVRPILAVYGQAINHMGPVGNGQLTKMVNQITVAGLIESLAEGLNFAQKEGLDANKVIDVISKGAAQSWQLEHRGPTMIEDKFDFGFAVDWMAKDLALCLAEAANVGAKAPAAALVLDRYRELQARGGGRWDFTSLIRLLRD